MVDFKMLRAALKQLGFRLEKGCSNEWGLSVKDDVKVGWDTVNGITRVGIDPLRCFNKTASCGVLAYFPMDEQEYEHMIKFLSETALSVGALHDTWVSESPHSWCGKLGLYGEYKRRDVC